MLDSVTDRRWFWDTELVAEALRQGQKVIQEPVTVRRKPDKKTSVRLMHDTWRQLLAIEAYRRRRRNATG